MLRQLKGHRLSFRLSAANTTCDAAEDQQTVFIVLMADPPLNCGNQKDMKTCIEAPEPLATAPPSCCCHSMRSHAHPAQLISRQDILYCVIYISTHQRIQKFHGKGPLVGMNLVIGKSLANCGATRPVCSSARR